MPRHKSLVKRCKVEVAQRQRTCKFSSESIPMGEVCLVVLEDGRKRSCYSAEIALEMIKAARVRLDEIESMLIK